MKGLNSEAYLNSLIKSFEKHDFLKNVIFISNDGASSVVSSTQNGLVWKLK